MPAGAPAQAAGSEAWEITVSGTWNPIVDDDSTIFGSSFSVNSNSFTKTFVVSTNAPGAFDSVWSACAGDEVNGKVFFDMGLRSGFVALQSTLDLHEGTRCFDPDIDGRVRTEVFEGGLDSATLDYTVRAHRL